VRAKILGYTLQDGQLNIVGSVLDPQCKRLIVSAYTQYGKTRAVAIGVLLRVLEQVKKKKIIFIGPTIDQINIIRNYVSELISADPRLASLVDSPRRSSAADLKKEMSKKRLTFKTGWEILTLTAHGAGEEPGKQLMGHGGDIIVIDEACLIEDEVYRKRISRMWGSNPDAEVIILVNPWHRQNFEFRAWRNPKYKKIHITWRHGVHEGRITEEFVEDQRKELTPYEFQVLYESEFAEDAEDTLIRWEWIQRALKKQIRFNGSTRIIWGLDVAEKGADKTILTSAKTDGVHYAVGSQRHLTERETMPTVNKVTTIVPKGEQINVDSIGVGAGVCSRLQELGFKVVSVRVSMAPEPKDDRYLNQKSQRWWEVRRVFEEDLISIPNEPQLIEQLSRMRYQFTASGKIQIIDPEGKSPDYADSLMLTLEVRGEKPFLYVVRR
jgi:hypothetical protein